VVDEVVRSGRHAIITRHGRPVTAMVALDPDELEDFVLATPRSSSVRGARQTRICGPDGCDVPMRSSTSWIALTFSGAQLRDLEPPSRSGRHL
jgi:antitoxin (DNA-binding transcriptional repressor) of toxin-antitoxin stability system